LRDQVHDDRLADLETRFKAILVRQKVCTQNTQRLDTIALAGKWQRAEEKACSDCATEEAKLAELTGQALTIIKEDGTTVVLPRVVEGLREDLDTVSKLLQEHKTDVMTQELQKDIERTIGEILEAIKTAQKQSEEQKQQEQGEQEEKPQALVPGSAELKLLRTAQKRVNDRTSSFEAARPPALTPAQQLLVKRIAELQRDVHNLAEELANQQ
jgi:hypothetical protein